MKDFRVEAIAQTELEEAALWYESQREGLGGDLIDEVDRVLVRIAHQQTFATSPIATTPTQVVRREFVARFPYIVIFVETEHMRRVIMIRRGNVDPRRWRARL